MKYRHFSYNFLWMIASLATNQNSSEKKTLVPCSAVAAVWMLFANGSFAVRIAQRLISSSTAPRCSRTERESSTTLVGRGRSCPVFWIRNPGIVQWCSCRDSKDESNQSPPPALTAAIASGLSSPALNDRSSPPLLDCSK